MICSSPYGPHVLNFKNHLKNILAKKPASSKKKYLQNIWKAVMRKYVETKKSMRDARPTDHSDVDDEIYKNANEAVSIP